MTLTLLDTMIFVAFIAAVVTVGLLKSRRDRNSESYFLAGRALGGGVIGISLIAANISTEQFVGMIGQAAGYQGLAPASYDWLAAIGLVILAFVFLPHFLRAGIYTMPEFLERRYNHWSRLLMALCTVPVLVLLVACVIYAGALSLTTFFGKAALFGILPINLISASWLLGIIAGIYVAAGGLKACAWADVIQGTALILGGLTITALAFCKLGAAPVSTLSSFSGMPVDITDTAGALEKFNALNSDRMHMVLPRNDPNLPWTALLLGLWIPNFYYWGLNQYITQRTLGSKSLAEGQKGMVMAASIQVVLPLVLIIPGMIAFNLFAGDMRQASVADNAPAMAAYAQANPDSSMVRVMAEPTAEALDALPDTLYVVAVFQHDESMATFATERPGVFPILEEDFNRADPAGQSVAFKSDDRLWAKTHPALAREMQEFNARSQMEPKNDVTRVEKLIAYKYDTAFGLLCGKVLPSGIGVQGFVLAAILGAIVSSLAAMLNAASTISTMDFFKKYLRPQATQMTVVTVGRVLVVTFMVLGVLIAPLLGDPKVSSSIFRLIQELQGYISPGILAVFVFGLINRTAPRWSGMIGLTLNPILYGAMTTFAADRIAFLDRMAICFAVVLGTMALLGLLKPMPTPVVFQTSTSINLESSRSAGVWGTVVVVITVLFYIVFW